MPRYFFHVREAGVLHPDYEGLELADAAQARREAENAAADAIHERVNARQGLNGDAYIVADESGATLFDVPLTSILPDPPE